MNDSSLHWLQLGETARARSPAWWVALAAANSCAVALVAGGWQDGRAALVHGVAATAMQAALFLGAERSFLRRRWSTLLDVLFCAALLAAVAQLLLAAAGPALFVAAKASADPSMRGTGGVSPPDWIFASPSTALAWAWAGSLAHLLGWFLFLLAIAAFLLM